MLAEFITIWQFMAIMMSGIGLMFLLITILFAAIEGRTDSTDGGLLVSGLFLATGVLFPATVLVAVATLGYGIYRMVKEYTWAR